LSRLPLVPYTNVGWTASRQIVGIADISADFFSIADPTPRAPTGTAVAQ
jgi:hypothetical protein